MITFLNVSIGLTCFHNVQITFLHLPNDFRSPVLIHFMEKRTDFFSTYTKHQIDRSFREANAPSINQSNHNKLSHAKRGAEFPSLPIDKCTALSASLPIFLPFSSSSLFVFPPIPFLVIPLFVNYGFKLNFFSFPSKSKLLLIASLCTRLKITLGIHESELMRTFLIYFLFEVIRRENRIYKAESLYFK